MKKIVYVSGLIALSALSLFTACKKDKEAFPTKSQSNGVTGDLEYVTPYFPSISDANGILIAARVTNSKVVVVSPVRTTYEYGMAKFTSVPGQFINLMDMGSIMLNDTSLTEDATFNYLSSVSNYSLNLLGNVNWKITNAGFDSTFSGTSFPQNTDTMTNWGDLWKPLTYTVFTKPDSSNYYVGGSFNATAYDKDYNQYVKDSTADYAVSFQVNLQGSTLNYDSVTIVFNDYSGYSYAKSWASDSVYASFRPIDFKDYPPTNINTSKLVMQKNAIKYESATIGGSKYYFLKMASDIKYYQSTK